MVMHQLQATGINSFKELSRKVQEHTLGQGGTVYNLDINVTAL